MDSLVKNARDFPTHAAAARALHIGYRAAQKMRTRDVRSKVRVCDICGKRVTKLPCVACQVREKAKPRNAREFAPASPFEKTLSLPLTALGIEVRIINQLEEALQVRTIRDLLHLRPWDVSRVSGLTN